MARPVIENPIKLLTPREEADILAGMLKALQDQQFRVRAVQIQNGHGDQEDCLAYQRKPDGKTAYTYEETLALIADHEANLWAMAEQRKLVTEIAKLVEAKQAEGEA